MEDSDIYPELDALPTFSRPDSSEGQAPYLIVSDEKPEPTSLLIFRRTLEDEPEQFLYAIGRAINRPINNDVRQPVGELYKSIQHVDGIMRSGVLRLIIGVDPETQMRLESDGDYQLVTNRFGYDSDAAKLRLLRTYLIRLLLFSNPPPEANDIENGGEAA